MREVFKLAVLDCGAPANPAFFKNRCHVWQDPACEGPFRLDVVAAGAGILEWLQEGTCEEQTRQLLVLLALSAKRIREVRFARPEYLPQSTKIWTTLEALVNRAKSHRVPMSRQVQVSWQSARLVSEATDLLFGKPGTKPNVLSENAALDLAKRFEIGRTGHGLRASLKSRARAQRRYEPGAIEYALENRLPDLEDGYQREDLLTERAKIMQDGADFVYHGRDPLDLTVTPAAVRLDRDEGA